MRNNEIVWRCRNNNITSVVLFCLSDLHGDVVIALHQGSRMVIGQDLEERARNNKSNKAKKHKQEEIRTRRGQKEDTKRTGSSPGHEHDHTSGPARKSKLFHLLTDSLTICSVGLVDPSSLTSSHPLSSVHQPSSPHLSMICFRPGHAPGLRSEASKDVDNQPQVQRSEKT